LRKKELEGSFTFNGTGITLKL